MKYGFAIDLSMCMGCHTCSVACKQNNNLPNGIWWNFVRTVGGPNKDTAEGTYPNVSMYHLPVNCQHCDNAACVEVCPTGASHKREDGLVLINQEECIGCESCRTACPYDVRTLYPTELLYSVDFAVGDADAPVHVGGIVGKCTGCYHRIDRGEVPACMELCPGRARYWGDLDDPNSDVSKFLASGVVAERLIEEAGTGPNVYYVH